MDLKLDLRTEVIRLMDNDRKLSMDQYERRLRSIKESEDIYLSNLPDFRGLPILDVTVGTEGWPLYIHLPMTFDLVEQVKERMADADYEPQSYGNYIYQNYQTLAFTKGYSLRNIYCKFYGVGADKIEDEQLGSIEDELCVFKKVGTQIKEREEDVFEIICQDGADEEVFE
jgi:hypothetical protein